MRAKRSNCLASLLGGRPQIARLKAKGCAPLMNPSDIQVSPPQTKKLTNPTALKDYDELN